MDGRLSKTFQTNAPANGATYAYDARGRLASRTVTQSAAPTTTTTLYLYDLADHIIAETDAGGVTQREYIWLDDLPVAVVDGVNTASQAIYYVATDHLMRPVLMTDQSQSWAWYAAYKPFGETATLVANPAVMNARFPGQWFQLETGLAYNWHRHYDPTIGRYIQPDPLLVDESGATLGGLPADALAGNQGNDGHAVAKSMGWRTAHDIIMRWPSSRAMLQDGPSVYGYAGQSPLVRTDKAGMMMSGNLSTFGEAGSCTTPGTPGPIIPVISKPANDNSSIPLCYGTVHSIGGYGVVNCSYVCDNGISYMGIGSMFQGQPFCPTLSAGN